MPVLALQAPGAASQPSSASAWPQKATVGGKLATGVGGPHRAFVLNECRGIPGHRIVDGSVWKETAPGTFVTELSDSTGALQLRATRRWSIGDRFPP